MKKILFTLMACVLSLGLVGGAFAYFSDTEESTGNTFTAGTLDLEIGASPADAIWVSPTNWAPGDAEVVAELSMSNTGSVGARLVGVKAQNLEQTAGWTGGTDLGDNILVTTIQYTEADGQYLYGNLATWYATCFGAAGTYMTLNEFVNSGYGMLFWTGNPPSDALGPHLSPGGTDIEKVKLGFTFSADAVNDCQGDTASFELEVTALQSFSQVTILEWGPTCHGYGEYD